MCCYGRQPVILTAVLHLPEQRSPVLSLNIPRRSSATNTSSHAALRGLGCRHSVSKGSGVEQQDQVCSGDIAACPRAVAQPEARPGRTAPEPMDRGASAPRLLLTRDMGTYILMFILWKLATTVAIGTCTTVSIGMPTGSPLDKLQCRQSVAAWRTPWRMLIAAMLLRWRSVVSSMAWWSLMTRRRSSVLQSSGVILKRRRRRPPCPRSSTLKCQQASQCGAATASSCLCWCPRNRNQIDCHVLDLHVRSCVPGKRSARVLDQVQDRTAMNAGAQAALATGGASCRL